MKKIQLTIEDLFDIPGSEIFNPDLFKPVTSVSIDSRNIPGSCIFIAIKGKRFDGHNFINDAIKNGAKALVINRRRLKEYENTGLPFITVKDTTIALGDIAKKWREKLQAKVIGITGSAGKTTTKEMISILLSEKFSVNKTVANNNNHIGVPLTILSTKAAHDLLVAELGTNHFGEIDYTANIAQPDYALITNIGDSHLEFLKNRKGVLKEKLALFEACAERNGTLFINNNDKLLKEILKSYPNKISYGFDNKSDVQAAITSYTEDGRANFEIKYNKTTLRAALPLYGEQNAKNFLASAAVAFKLGLTKEEILRGIKKLNAVEKRLNVKRNKNFFLIDDSYNANPDSMKASLDLLGKISVHRKKIAILGDMFELGEETIKKHKEIIPIIRRNRIDEVYTIGKFSKIISEGLRNSKITAKHFSGRRSLTGFLSKYNFNNSVILVKGSRGMRMEEFVKTIEERTKE